MEENHISTSEDTQWVTLDSRGFYLKSIDVNSLTRNWPLRLRKQTSVHVEVYSDEDVMLEALERSEIKTGYRIEQDSNSIHAFNVVFKGWQIADRLTIRDKYVGARIQDELTVDVTNYGNDSVFLRKGTPLGHLIISANC